jgi:HEAT repeat protein
MDSSAALAPIFTAADRGDWPEVLQYLNALSVAGNGPDEILKLSLAASADDDLESAREIAKFLDYELAVPALLAFLTDPATDPEQQWLLLEFLGKCPPALTVAQVADCLVTATNSAVVDCLVRALVEFGPEAIDHLTVLLRQPEQRMIAIAALARIRHSQTIEPLLSVMTDPDPVVQEIALEALSSFHDQRVPPLLLTKLTDIHATLRRVAATGLGLRKDLVLTLDLVSNLQPLLQDPEPAVAIAAAVALGRMDTDDAGAALTSIDPAWSSELGLQILRSLGWLNRVAVLDALDRILEQEVVDGWSENAAIEAIRAVGQQRVDADRASQSLMNFLKRSAASLTVRSQQEIVVAIGNLQGSQMVDHLVQCLDDAQKPVRWQAIYFLQQQGETVHARLQALAARPNNLPELQSTLAECLSSWPLAGTTSKL